jgi:hypothetical protein
MNERRNGKKRYAVCGFGDEKNKRGTKLERFSLESNMLSDILSR